MERFLSFAQELEDLIIYNALRNVKDGFYIDVGANDPWWISVTKALYEKGWHGINIEPQLDSYQNLCQDRPRDINLQIGCADRDGELTLHGSGAMASFVTNDSENGNEAQSNSFFVPVLTLKSVCDTYCHAQTIHVLKIDVEGFEKEVLEGMDFVNYRPWLIVVEATEPGTYIACHEKWEFLLLDQGYTLAFAYGINRYYIDNTKSELKERFLPVNELLSKYYVWGKMINLTVDNMDSYSMETQQKTEGRHSMRFILDVMYGLCMKLPEAVKALIKRRPSV